MEMELIMRESLSLVLYPPSRANKDKRKSVRLGVTYLWREVQNPYDSRLNPWLVTTVDEVEIAGDKTRILANSRPPYPQKQDPSGQVPPPFGNHR